MLRNCTLYRKLWYIKKRSSKTMRIYFRLLIMIIILSLLVLYANKRLIPCIDKIAVERAKSIAVMYINDTVNDVFSSSVKYKDIAFIQTDKDGRITAIQTDVIKMNKLMAMVSRDIQQKLNDEDVQKVSIPFGSMLGNSIFEGIGPNIYVNLKNSSIVKTDFKSEFYREGINQIRHSIYVEVKAIIEIEGPFINQKPDVFVKIPVADTIIVGTVPDIFLSYAELKGN